MTLPTSKPDGKSQATLFDQFADAAFVFGYVTLAWLVFGNQSLQGTALQPIIGLPLLLFLPGYVLMSVLFPGQVESGKEEHSVGDGAKLWPRQVDLTERAALSFGMSVAIVPPFGLALSMTSGRFSLSSILGGLSLLIVVGMIIGVLQRLRLPAQNRYYIPVRRWVARGRSAVFDAPGFADAMVNLMLFLAVILAFSTITYALVVPNHQESYTSFYLVTEDESGELVASDYPTTFSSGQPQELIIGVENHEREETSYTIVIELQRVEQSNGEVTILEEEELDRLHLRLAANETRIQRQSITPGMTGENLRLKFFLYRGEAPANPDSETAYRHLHIWIDVTAAVASDVSELTRPAWASMG